MKTTNENSETSLTVAKITVKGFIIIALILVSMFTIQSCESTDELGIEKLTLEEFVENNMLINQKILALTKNEKDIDTSVLSEENFNLVTNENDLKDLFVRANFKQHKKLFILFDELADNANNFVKMNPDLYKLNEVERTKQFSKEIDDQQGF